MLKIFQIDKSRIPSFSSLTDCVKTDEGRAWLSATQGDVAAALHLDLYVHVASVDARFGNSLDDAFTIMNRWNDDDEKRVIRLAPLHSLSVGDIVEDNGDQYVVKNFGWDKLITVFDHGDCRVFQTQASKIFPKQPLNTQDLAKARATLEEAGGWLLDLGDGNFLVTDDEVIVFGLRGREFITRSGQEAKWDETSIIND